VLSQSFCDFELLLIDDGSTDGSGAICDAYSQRDPRIKVFHQDNGGVSSARNLGLENANGEWVYFVDSDDELLPEGLKTMVDCIREDIDVILAGYEICDEGGNLVNSVPDRVEVLLNKTVSLSTLYEKHALFYRFLPYLWIRFLRRSIIKDKHIWFDTGLCNKEDTLFLTQYICRSNGRTVFTTTPVYRYNTRPDSAMGAWKRGFDYRYIDSLYALIKMKREIRCLFSPFREIVFIADEGIWIRYKKILKRMVSLGISDLDLQRQMKRDVYRELRPQFFVRKKLRSLKKRLCSD
jgi:glycosyltransferase involved in cell wall biosynthesis